MKANEKDTKPDETAVIRKLSLVGIIGNVFLSAFKFIAGIMGNSSAMVSDAVHSLSDVFATFIAFLGVRFGRREADASHPYGHERIESLAAIVLGLILLVTGVRLECQRANDAMSSIGALVGVGGSMLGYPVLDPIASVVICLFILKQGISIIYDALKKMLDTSCGEQFEEEVRQLVDAENQVEHIDMLRTRMFGDKVYIDMEIAIDGSMQLTDAHAIAERVHDDIEHAFPEVKHVMIHVNPA